MLTIKRSIKPVYVIIGLLLIGAVVLATISFVQPKLPAPANVSQTPLPSGIYNPNPVNYNLNLKNTVETERVETHQSHYPEDVAIIKLLQDKFKLQNPQLTSTPSLVKYAWNNNGQTLSYYPTTHTFSFYNPQVLDSTKPLSSSIESDARMYLQEKFPFYEKIKLEPIKLSYLLSNGTVAKEVDSAKANLVEIEYRFTFNDGPVYLLPYEQKDVAIQLNWEGVRTVKAKLPPEVTKTTKTAKVISEDTAKSKLLNNEGIILKVVNQLNTETGPLFAIGNMTVKQVRLGYIFTNNLLAPAYIFQGTSVNATDQKTRYTVEVAIPTGEE